MNRRFLQVAPLPAPCRRRLLVLAGVAALGLAACDDGSKSSDPNTEVGPNPTLPAQKQYLMPPMTVAKVVGWRDGETPAVAQGLKIRALAGGLQHPRSLYVLPNGDILVVESVAPKAPAAKRPKDLIMQWVESLATSGGKIKGSNRITLLRDADGDGVPETRTVFLDHLNSPFGVALVGNDLYVADTDAIVRYPYTQGDTQITAPGTILTPLPGGPIDHHWTKSLLASPDGSLLYVGVGSNSNITENGIEAEKNRAAILEVERATGRWRVYADGLRNPNGLSWEPQTGALWTVVNERDELGPNLVPDYMTSVQDGGFYGWPYSYYGRNLDPRVKPQRPDLVDRALVPDYALGPHVAPWAWPSIPAPPCPTAIAVVPSSGNMAAGTEIFQMDIKWSSSPSATVSPTASPRMW
ncbi:PQQ-dependent sugar dehydrogenase [Nitrospirillum iridis]|uniref:Glucose/arabinose dehydrogenase n=1 Tax=Nitrospirillum iridis TaxID=765888 RepID=A0A7X0EE07_9PROT|nr:PQQ-dependent sugar dehydrogenase [Nitrospirillum iridis]MBB6250949.1 glucose/arabinose dehydrogenase [Nitrospirillum iridis]